jgi:hypothetical protein
LNAVVPDSDAAIQLVQVEPVFVFEEIDIFFLEVYRFNVTILKRTLGEDETFL